MRWMLFVAASAACACSEPTRLALELPDDLGAEGWMLFAVGREGQVEVTAWDLSVLREEPAQLLETESDGARVQLALTVIEEPPILLRHGMAPRWANVAGPEDVRVAAGRFRITVRSLCR